MMDRDETFRLISFIQERPQLWQKQHKDFSNRDIRTHTFKELAQLTGIPDELCKKKLKNLKDKMREVTSKLPKTPSGQPAYDRGARWTFFEAMLFMKDEFVYKDPNDSHDDLETNDSFVSSADSDVESQQAIHMRKPCTTSPASSCKTASTSKTASNLKTISTSKSTPTSKHSSRSSQPPTKRSRVMEEFVSVERGGKADAVHQSVIKSEKQRDEWDTFCSSIACDLRKIRDPLVVMHVKAKIHQTVHDAVLQQLQQETCTLPPGETFYPKYELI